MHIVQCDNYKEERPRGFGRQEGWIRVEYSGNPMAATFDLCPSCGNDVLVTEKLAKFLPKKESS